MRATVLLLVALLGALVLVGCLVPPGHVPRPHGAPHLYVPAPPGIYIP
jgi:hypothetical protein